MKNLIAFRWALLPLFALAPVVAGAQSLYVTSYDTNQIKKYDPATGSFLANIGGAELAHPIAVTMGTGGDLFVLGDGSNNVYRYDATTGAYKGVFATGAGLSNPQDLLFGPTGDLYVSNFGTASVLRFDGATGASKGTFASGNGLNPNINDLCFMPGGDLLVTDNPTGKILRYNGTTGAFVGTFANVAGVDAATCGTGGDLFVTRFTGPNPSVNEVDRLNGTTGASKGVFVNDSHVVGIDDLAFGPGGDLFVSTDLNIVPRYDGTTAAYKFNAASGSGLSGAISIAITPEPTGLLALAILFPLIPRRRA
jgi:WD40 repeat protein